MRHYHIPEMTIVLADSETINQINFLCGGWETSLVDKGALVLRPWQRENGEMPVVTGDY
jgi:hypothetical protein